MFMCAMRITTPVCHTLKCTNVHVCYAHYHTCMSYLEMYKCACVPCLLPCLITVVTLLRVHLYMYTCAICIIIPDSKVTLLKY